MIVLAIVLGVSMSTSTAPVVSMPTCADLDFAIQDDGTLAAFTQQGCSSVRSLAISNYARTLTLPGLGKAGNILISDVGTATAPVNISFPDLAVAVSFKVHSAFVSAVSAPKLTDIADTLEV